MAVISVIKAVDPAEIGKKVYVSYKELNASCYSVRLGVVPYTDLHLT